MFTGLIDDVGTVARAGDTPAGRELLVQCRYQDVAPGESVALNGACLTVRERGPGWFTVAAVVTSLGRTAIGEWRAGTRVNLERALRAGAPLGGHLVQGHVDGVGTVTGVRRSGDALLVEVRAPRELVEQMVLHGSLAVDGVSLTVNDLLPPDIVQLSLIDYTLHHTTLGALAPGAHVHLETDIVGKYVQRMLAPVAAARAG